MYSIIEQNRIRDHMLRERLDTVLPAVMEETDTPFWLILCREYNEDPVFPFITPSLYPTARRLTILVFADYGRERISLSMPDDALDQYYRNDWNRKNETQIQALERVIRTYDPGKIAVNLSEDYAYTGGLSAGLLKMLERELPREITERFVSSDTAGIRLLETRTDSELRYWPEVMKEALEIIGSAFSDEVIIPGVTTCRDVMDYMTEQVNRRGISCWFPPDIDLQNENGRQGEDTVIQRGDLLHCDFGITYLGLCTDTQRLCYVRKTPGEELPGELAAAMIRNNRFQDIVRSQMQDGCTGNEVFLESVRKAREEGIRPMPYSHPLGLFGHGCGPTIGLWNDQGPVYPSGENRIHDRTGYALELSTIEYLDMYKRDTYIFTEESVVHVNGNTDFLIEGRDRIKVIG